jgi:hypothetical protein
MESRSRRKSKKSNCSEYNTAHRNDNVDHQGLKNKTGFINIPVHGTPRFGRVQKVNKPFLSEINKLQGACYEE